MREIIHPAKMPVAVRYSLARASLAPAQTTLPHVLERAEVYYILSGRGSMHIDDEVMEVGKDDTVYIPSGRVQFIANTANESLEFLCIVDPAWSPEIERVLNGDRSSGA